MFTKNDGAFTLAEVLVTLGIIGVVAAMTMPLINKYKIKVFETSFKRTYSTMIRALDMTSQEYGVTNFRELKALYCGDLNQFDQDENLQQKCTEQMNKIMPEVNLIFRKYMGVIGNETIKPNTYTLTNFLGEKYDYTNLGALSEDASTSAFRTYYLKDGSSITGLRYRENQITLTFDTNGPKKGPNRLGYDIFEYEYPKWRNCKDWCSNNKVVSGWMVGLGCWYCAVSDTNAEGTKGYWESLY